MNRGLPDRPYVGFWNRTAAALIDSALLLVVVLPIQHWACRAKVRQASGTSW